jgi:methyl-accepting chemotaxis protein
MAQVDAVTQQNAALVEEAAGAAESFMSEARRLAEVVGRFKTDRNDDRGRVIALVKQAVQHVRRHGVKRACADFNDPQGEFVRGEDYVFALAGDGTQLAFAPDARVVGRNNVDEKDPNGKVVGREILAVARDPGFGWVDYHFVNPKTGRIEPKSVYVDGVEGIILGCGIYRNDAAPDSSRVQRLAAPGVSSWSLLGRA